MGERHATIGSMGPQWEYLVEVSTGHIGGITRAFMAGPIKVCLRLKAIAELSKGKCQQCAHLLPKNDNQLTTAYIGDCA